MTISSVAVATTVLMVLALLWSVLCVTLVHGTSFQFYTDQWAVEIVDANVSYAKEVAQRHGFTYVTTVSNYKRDNWTLWFAQYIDVMHTVSCMHFKILLRMVLTEHGFIGYYIFGSVFGNVLSTMAFMVEINL